MNLIERALAHDGFRGVLAFTLREALWLHHQGICDDILVAYPTVDRGALAELTSSPEAAADLVIMVDSPAPPDVLDGPRPPGGAGTTRVWSQLRPRAPPRHQLEPLALLPCCAAALVAPTHKPAQIPQHSTPGA